jgi:hypothetical protein
MVKYCDNSRRIITVQRRGGKVRYRETDYPDVKPPKPLLYAYRVMEYIGKGVLDRKLAKTFATCVLEVAGLNFA